MNDDPCVIILAGGQGSRLRPYTKVLPKPLIPVCDVPILEVLIHQLRSEGLRRLILAVNYHEGLVRSYFGDGSELGVQIQYSREDRPLGTIGPLKLVADEMPEHFLVMCGDLLCDMGFRSLLASHSASGHLLTVATCKRVIQINDGVIEAAEDGTVLSFQEKPTIDVWISMGIYAMSRSILKYIPDDRPFGMDELILALLSAGEPINTYRHDGEWYGIGTPSELERANAALTERRGKFLRAESDLIEVA